MLTSTLTRRAEFEGELPCPVCSKPMQVRIAKTQKPYFMCNPCGVQLFVRRPEGMDRLTERLKIFEERRGAFELADASVAELESRLRTIDALKAQIKRLDERATGFSPDRDLVRTRNALKERLEREIKHLEGH